MANILTKTSLFLSMQKSERPLDYKPAFCSLHVVLIDFSLLVVGAFLIQDSDIEVNMRQASFGDSITFAGKTIDFFKKAGN